MVCCIALHQVYNLKMCIRDRINIDQVFERFYKADVARSKTSTGLGLSIAKELVSRMDGEIEAKIEKEEFIVEMNFPIVTDAK